MKYLLLLAFFTHGSLINTMAQPGFLRTKNAYLGQKPPGDQPEIFAESLLMIKDTFPMGRVAFSRDGTEFYYTSSNTWNNSEPTRIRYFKYADGKWNGPFVLNAHYDTPTFSTDGNQLFFVGGKRPPGRYIVWQSTREPNGSWTAPAVYINARYPLYNFMPAASGICYAGSRIHEDTTRRDMDICQLKMLPGDTTIRSLGEPINTKEFDGDFFVATDESYMIVSTKETKDYESELWISFHRRDGSWAPLISLGPKINNGPAHRWGQYVSPDGKYLFYSTGHSPQDCRIVWVRFDHLLTTLKKQSQK